MHTVAAKADRENESTASEPILAAAPTTHDLLQPPTWSQYWFPLVLNHESKESRHDVQQENPNESVDEQESKGSGDELALEDSIERIEPSASRICTVTSQTMASAPDGSDDSRTVVGPGEAVLFKANRRANWHTSSGTPMSTESGRRKFEWQAPSTPGKSTITATPVGRRAPCSITITTIEPWSIMFNKIEELSYAAGMAGAGMRLDAEFAPDNVSFQNLQWLELPGPATEVNGFFEGIPASGSCPPSGVTLQHCPNPTWVNIDWRNTQRDKALLTWGTGPWGFGTFEWKISNRYRVNGESDEHPLPDTTQWFMLEPSGKVTIIKFPAMVEREP